VDPAAHPVVRHVAPRVAPRAVCLAAAPLHASMYRVLFPAVPHAARRAAPLAETETGRNAVDGAPQLGIGKLFVPTKKKKIHPHDKMQNDCCFLDFL
jgi:hypothetical protein